MAVFPRELKLGMAPENWYCIDASKFGKDACHYDNKWGTQRPQMRDKGDSGGAG